MRMIFSVVRPPDRQSVEDTPGDGHRVGEGDGLDQGDAAGHQPLGESVSQEGGGMMLRGDVDD